MNIREVPLLGLSARIPPSNHQAEQALLGALMANNQACRHVEGLLEPRHFCDPVHGAIFEAILRGFRTKKLVDAITLRAEFEHTGVLDEVGGTAYVAQLMTSPHGIINAGEYGRAIHDAWVRRELIDIGEEIVNRAFGADPELDGEQQVHAAVRRLAATVHRSPVVALHRPEIERLVEYHRALGSHFEGMRPRPYGMAAFHEHRAATLYDLLDRTDPADVFTEGEMVDGSGVDMRHPDERPSDHPP